MLKKLTKFFIGVILVFISLAAITLIYYQFDDDLNPEAAQVINYTPESIAPSNNAYYHLLGLFAEKDKEPVEKGLEIIEHAKVFNETQKNSENTFLFIEDIKDALVIIPSDTKELCPSIDKACLEDVKNRNLVYTELSEDNALLLRRFRYVYQFEQYQEAKQLLASSHIMKIHKISLMDIALKWSNGERESALMLLDRDLHFQRMVLSSDLSLISKMITIAMVARDLRLLSEFISDCYDCSDFELKMTSIQKPMSKSELSLRKAFEYEYRHTHNLIANTSWELESQDVLYFLFYKENSILNTIYKQYNYIIELSECEFRIFIKCQKKYEKNTNSEINYFSWKFINDPLGSIYLNISQPAYNGYARTTYLLESFRRLILVKNLIYKNKISKNSLQKYLDGLPENLKDPFTGSAIKWDERQNLLTMNAGSEEDLEISVEL